MLYDAHVHVGMFDDIESLVKCALLSNITPICVGITLDESLHTLELFKAQNIKLPVFVGIHPWYLKDQKFDFSLIEKLLSFENVVGIGECGLDNKIEIPVNSQIEVLEQHLELASKYADFSYQIGKNIYGASKNEIDRAFREKKFPCSSGSLVNRFSGFNNLKYICGFKRWKRDVIYSREDLILLLKKKIKEYNRELTIKEINNDRELPGMKTFFSKFNTCSINEIYKIIKNQS